MSEPTSGSPAAQDNASVGPLVYLDYNCFQRGFDDPAQVRIQMEALACQEVLRTGGEKRDHSGLVAHAWTRRSSVHFPPAG